MKSLAYATSSRPPRFTAVRATASLFGALAGLGGLTHGVGEVLQESVQPDSLIINSWVRGPIATNMGGEPGMTVVPNLLVTGLLCILVSLMLVIWSVGFVNARRGGLVQLVLAAAMLLFGGGFGPPIIGALAGAAGIKLDSQRRERPSRLPAGVQRVLADAWPWVFAVCATSGVLLVLGSLVLIWTINLNAPDFFVANFFFTVVTLSMTVLSSTAYDTAMRERGVAPTRLRRLFGSIGIILSLSTVLIPAASRAENPPDAVRNHYVGTSLLSIPSWIPGDDIVYFEVDYGYRVRAKDHIMVALDLYQYKSPMSAPWTDPLVYPGPVLSYGVILAYQWYFLADFFLMQMLNPLVLDYHADDGRKVQTGFMLLAATRLGYNVQFNLWNVPSYLEIGVEVSYWPYNGNVPAAFKDVDDEYGSYVFSPALNFGAEF